MGNDELGLRLDKKSAVTLRENISAALESIEEAEDHLHWHNVGQDIWEELKKSAVFLEHSLEMLSSREDLELSEDD